MQARFGKTVHFVLKALAMTSAVFCSTLTADEFVEIAEGNFVRFGAQVELSPDNKRGIANIGFVVGQESVAIIDPGGNAADAKQLKAAIAARTALPVSHVILTHFHPDHVLAGQAFKDVAHVIAHRRYSAAMVQRGEFYLNSFGGLISHSSDPGWLVPTINVEDKVSVDLGGRTLQVSAHETAHTDNDISVFDSKTQTLWASDLVFSERMPALDGSLRGWLSVLMELELMRPVLIIPGHGPAGNWQQTVLPQVTYLRNLLLQTRKAIAKGLSLSATINNSRVEKFGKWLLFDLYHNRNLTKAYAELEWE